MNKENETLKELRDLQRFLFIILCYHFRVDIRNILPWGTKMITLQDFFLGMKHDAA